MDQSHAPYFEALCASGITTEMADHANVLASITMGHTKADLDRFVDALLHIPEHPSEHNLNSQGFVERALYEVPEQVLSPGEVFHATQERGNVRVVF